MTNQPAADVLVQDLIRLAHKHAHALSAAEPGLRQLFAQAIATAAAPLPAPRPAETAVSDALPLAQEIAASTQELSLQTDAVDAALVALGDAGEAVRDAGEETLALLQLQQARDAARRAFRVLTRQVRQAESFPLSESALAEAVSAACPALLAWRELGPSARDAAFSAEYRNAQRLVRGLESETHAVESEVSTWLAAQLQALIALRAHDLSSQQRARRARTDAAEATADATRALLQRLQVAGASPTTTPSLERAHAAARAAHAAVATASALEAQLAELELGVAQDPSEAPSRWQRIALETLAQVESAWQPLRPVWLLQRLTAQLAEQCAA